MRKKTDTAEVVALYKSGLGLRDIAKQISAPPFNYVSHLAVYRALRQHEKRTGETVMRDAHKARRSWEKKHSKVHRLGPEIVRLYLGGLSMELIGNRLSISTGTVHHALRRQNVPRRTRSEAQRLMWQRITAVPEVKQC